MKKFFQNKIVRAVLRWLLAAEGTLHFILPAITLYGMWQEGVLFNFLILINPMFDILFGIICLLSSYALGEKEHHHH